MILVNLVSKTGRTFQWRCGVLFGTYSFRIKGANQPDLYVWDPKLKTPQDDQQKCEKLWPAIMVHGRGSAFWFGKMAREKKALPWSACSKAYLVGSWATPLKNVRYISQLGSLFPIYGKIKNVPNHQPVYIYAEAYTCCPPVFCFYTLPSCLSPASETGLPASPENRGSYGIQRRPKKGS